MPTPIPHSEPQHTAPTRAPVQIVPEPCADPILVATARNASHDAVMRLAWALASGTHAGVQIVNAAEEAAAIQAPAEDEADQRADHVLARAARSGHARLVLVGRGRPGTRERERSDATVVRLLRQLETPVYAAAPEAGVLARRAVVGIDFSEGATHAAQVALDLLAPDATVTLVHVWSHSGDPTAWERTYEHAIPSLFEMVRPRLAAPSSMRIETLALMSDTPGIALADIASRAGADLVVVGTQGQGGANRLVLGSVATSLLRTVSCSCLCVPPAATTSGITHGVMPLDVA